jgi:hypothetical protein
VVAEKPTVRKTLTVATRPGGREAAASGESPAGVCQAGRASVTYLAYTHSRRLSRTLRYRSGEVVSPRGGVKPPLHPIFRLDFVAQSPAPPGLCGSCG